MADIKTTTVLIMGGEMIMIIQDQGVMSIDHVDVTDMLIDAETSMITRDQAEMIFDQTVMTAMKMVGEMIIDQMVVTAMITVEEMITTMTAIMMDGETIMEMDQGEVVSRSQRGIIYVTFLAFQNQAGIIIDLMEAAALIIGKEMHMTMITGEDMIMTIINPMDATALIMGVGRDVCDY